MYRHFLLVLTSFVACLLAHSLGKSIPPSTQTSNEPSEKLLWVILKCLFGDPSGIKTQNTNNETNCEELLALANRGSLTSVNLRSQNYSKTEGQNDSNLLEDVLSSQKNGSVNVDEEEEILMEAFVTSQVVMSTLEWIVSSVLDFARVFAL